MFVNVRRGRQPYLAQRVAVRVHQVDIAVPVPHRGEGYLLPVGLHFRMVILKAVVGQARQARPIPVHDVYLAVSIAGGSEEDAAIGGERGMPVDHRGSGEGQLGLARAVGIHYPDFLVAVAVGGENNPGGVPVQVRGQVGSRVAGQPGLAAAVPVHYVDLVGPAAGAGEDNFASIRGNMRPLVGAVGQG